MSAGTIGALIDAAIPLAGGVVCTLLAFRSIGKKPGEDARSDAWHRRFGAAMKVVGPALIVFAPVRGVG